MTIFKGYDIRGIVPTELDEEVMYNLGRAFVSYLGCKEVVVGRDARKNSESFFKALARGITDQGADVIDIGLSSTPLFYFAVRDAEAGLVITASHNPAQYNGLKLTRDGTVPIGQSSGLLDIKAIYEKGDFKEVEKKGSITKREVMQAYIDFFKPYGEGLKGMKVVVDTGNGMGGYTFPKVLDSLGIDYVPLYMDLDMTFPNHEANPIKTENLVDLQKKVVEEKADLGVSIDGDADRCAFVDEKGNIIVSDYITALIGAHVAKEHPGSKIVYDLRSTRVIKEEVEKAGGEALVCRVGHAFIKLLMRKHDSVFAGELSGHFYYKNVGIAESSILTLLLTMQILKESGEKFSELMAPLIRYPKIEETNFRVDDKEGKMKEIEVGFSDAEILHIDGVSVVYKDAWANVRASNTEPYLRLTMEADTQERLDEMKKKIYSIIGSDPV